MTQKAGREEWDAMQRLKAWEANKHRYPNNTEWWRDFYLFPSHAKSEDEARELIRKAADKIAAEELEAKEEAEGIAKRWEAINKTPEARASRRADALRLLSLNLGHLGVVFLLLYFAIRLAGREGLPALDVLWIVNLFVTPLCYVMAIVFTFRATSLWAKAQGQGKSR